MSVRIIRINMIDKKVLGFRLIKKSPATQNINKCYGDAPIQMSWFTKKMKAFIEKLFPNFHVETKAQFKARMKANHDSEMEGLTVGKIQKIIYSPEDMKKMESMTLKEQIEYKNLLRDQGKYTLED